MERPRRGRPGQLTSNARDRLATAVYSLLNVEDVTLALNRRAHEIEWRRYKKGRGPLAGAVKKVLAEDARITNPMARKQFEGRKVATLKKAAKKWFLRKYCAQVCNQL